MIDFGVMDFGVMMVVLRYSSFASLCLASLCFTSFHFASLLSLLRCASQGGRAGSGERDVTRRVTKVWWHEKMWMRVTSGFDFKVFFLWIHRIAHGPRCLQKIKKHANTAKRHNNTVISRDLPQSEDSGLWPTYLQWTEAHFSQWPEAHLSQWPEAHFFHWPLAHFFQWPMAHFQQRFSDFQDFQWPPAHFQWPPAHFQACSLAFFTISIMV